MILLVVDAHSKWVEAFPVTTASSATTIERLRQVPYSGKFSLGANFRDFRGRTCFRENKNPQKMKNDDVITCIRRVPM